MNTRILLLAISIAALSSCSSVYKSGQTPDDVYYSAAPARVQGDDSYVDVNHQKDGTNNYQTYDQYQDSYRDDRFLRMSVGDPYYMNAYNSYSGFDWRYNSYYSGFNYGFNSPWNNYFAWNSYYNPYCYYGTPGLYYGYHSSGYGGGIVSAAAPISRPVAFNVNSYSNGNKTNSRAYLNNSNYSNYNNSNRYNNNNANSGGRNSTYYNNNNSSNGRNSYTPSNSNNNSYTPSRSYTPSSSGSSSGSSSSGGGASRPARGN